jgi:hypothetical protein
MYSELDTVYTNIGIKINSKNLLTIFLFINLVFIFFLLKLMSSL